MTEEEKFEEIIRRKFDEKEFIFNEENWEKAEQKIISARRSTKIVRWIAIFTIGLFTGVAVMFPFIEIDNTEKTIEVADVIKTPNPENKSSELKKETSKKFSEENTSAVSQSETRVENKDDEKEIFNSSEKPKTLTDIADTKIRAEDKMTDKQNYSRPIKPNKKTAEVNSHENSVNEQKEVIQLGKSKFSEHSKKNDEDVLSEEMQLLAVNEARPNKSATQADADATNDSEKNQQENNSARENELTLSEIPATKTKARKDSLIETPVHTDSANTLNQKTDAEIVMKDSVQSKTDSSAVVSQSNLVEPAPMRGLASANIVSVEAGTNFALGWKYNDTLEARGFTPVIGIGFTHCFNPKWSMSFGVQYGSIANLKASRRVFSYKTFDFGYNTVDTVVDTKRIYYAVFPVQWQYNFNNKNCIGIGGSFSYLLNTTSNISIYTNNTNPIQKKEIGYYAGAFKKSDVSLSVLYRRRISQKFSVSFSANYGLIDIKSDAFFSREKFERNSGLKMIITYDLFQY